MGGNAPPIVAGITDRLVLGTAQLGMAYGVANRTGMPDMGRAAAVIAAAVGCGIREFDTAQAYGTSERFLGQIFVEQGLMDHVKVVTKGHSSGEDRAFQSLRDRVKRSLHTLGMRRLFGFMLHKEQLLDRWSGELGDDMNALVDEGLVEHIGASVYSPERALQALAVEGIDIVQIPSNVLDRRFENAGVFRAAAIRKKRIYVRSIFLQGLLTIRPEVLPLQMTFAAPALKAFRSLADLQSISPHQLAIGYVRDAYPDAKIIFGAETPEQVRINVEAWRTPMAEDMLDMVRDCLSDIEGRVLNPALW